MGCVIGEELLLCIFKKAFYLSHTYTYTVMCFACICIVA